MIRIFKGDETNFSHDGVEVLDDITISSYTQWQENGKWNIEAKFKKDFDKSESIKDNMILKVPTEKGEQLFRIKYTNKQNKKYISVIGDHIGFDFNDNFIQDINIVEKSGNAAINQISGGTVYANKYTLTSNIGKVASARMVRKNGIDALISEADNSFINRWGGYLVLDNFNIAMNESTGIDRGVEITIGKNIKGFTGVIDSNNICTGINAISFDGIKLPEGVYYSPLVDNYDHPKIQEFKFEDIRYKYSENNFEQDGYETLEEVYSAMREACNELFSVYNIDKPKCTLRVDIVALENTDQYKGDELNERIFQGDILTANLEEYGFPVKLKMVMNRYDNILDRYIDIDLGETRNNLVIGINNIKNNVDKVLDQLGGKTWEDILNESMDKATQLIAEGIKDSYVVCRKNEILVMDNPVVESAINVIRINKNGIAFSRMGYNGPFTIAITIDGKINASCILTGELDAALIKTGLLSSANGTTWINMEDGTFNLADKITYDGTNLIFGSDVTLSWGQIEGKPSVPNGSQIDDLGNYTGVIDYTTQVDGKPTIITADDVKNTIITKDWIATLGLLVGKEIRMGSGAVIDWNSVAPPTANQVGAKPSSYVPSYSEISGTKPPTNADNTASVVGSKLTKITSTGIYTGEVKASQIAAHTISIEHLTSATKDPIIKLFGGCSIDATASMEQGIGSAVRLKWDANNYIYISTNNITLYQSGSGQYVFNTAGFYLYNRNIVIDSGFLIIGGKINRGWGFSSGNKYWFGISADDTYVRMYNDDVTVADGVSYLGSPSGRFIKLYSTQAVDVSSDFRKKDNIMPYDTQLEMFYDLLRPISYTLKQGHSGRRHLGFIAQEVEEAMNEVGMEYKDLSFLQKAPIDINGNEIDPTTIENYETDERIADYDYSLAYTELIALNTHMIQKLREENQQLKNEIIEIKKVLGL